MEKKRLHRKSLDIVQNCWVVPDINAAMRKWLDMGYGPFVTFDLELPHALYRGQQVPLIVSIALTHGGGVQIELVQQRSLGPSIYRDMYGPDEGGFHHMCIVTDDYPAELARLRRQGFVIAAEGEALGLHFAYADTRESMGCMLEVIGDVPMLQEVYKAVADAARDWDGSDPIRPLKL